MLRDTTSAREVPFRDVHDSITTTVKYRDLAGDCPRGERKFLTGLRRPASLDATDAQGKPPSLREFGPFPERLISAIRLLGLMVKAVRRKLRR